MKKDIARKKTVFVSKNKKGQKSEIRQNLIQLNEIGPNLDTSIDCQRRRSPSASIDRQEEEPGASSAKRSSQPSQSRLLQATRLSKAPWSFV